MAGQIEIQSKIALMRLDYIKSAIKDFKRQDRVCKNLTLLSEALSEYIDLKCAEKIHPGTLRRNPEFRTLLTNFLTSEKERSSIVSDAVSVSIELRQAKKQILQLKNELELANTQYLLEREKFLQLTSGPKATIETFGEFSSKRHDLELELSSAYDLVLQLMEYSHGFKSDIVNGLVVNLLNNEVVMTKEQYPNFFTTLKKDFDC
jgi:hypothetical protein